MLSDTLCLVCYSSNLTDLKSRFARFNVPNKTLQNIITPENTPTWGPREKRLTILLW